MRVQLVAVALVATTLGACVSRTQTAAAPPEPAGVPTTLSAQQIKIVQAGVRSYLKDPDSAKFSGPTVAAKKPSGEIVACGFVNAKNSYGGYVGDSPFIAKLVNGKVLDATTGSGSTSSILAKMCRDEGVPL